jgi:hypothetical protein
VASAARHEQLHSTPAEDPEPPVGSHLSQRLKMQSQSRHQVPRRTLASGAVAFAAKTIRLRDKEHCKFVRAEPCVVCGRAPTEAHHIRFAQLRALGRKVSDEYTVPVCRLHHRDLHSYGDEAS